MNMMDGVRSSCCIYDGEKGKIVLYFVGDMEGKALAAALRDKLPRYMLPNIVERLDIMPLTANGKLDRVGLKKKYEESKK